MRERLFVASAVGAVALLGVVALVVFVTGLERAGIPPSLRSNPNPAIAGRVAYLRADGCLAVVEASGAGARQVTCLPPLSVRAVAWVDGDTLAVALEAGAAAPAGTPSGEGSPPTPATPPVRGEPVWALVNLKDGVPRSTNRTASELPDVPGPSGLTGPDGRVAWADLREPAVYVSAPGGRELLYRFSGNAPVSLVAWSPDGRWLLAARWRSGVGYALVVVAGDGGYAATLVEDSGSPMAAWWVEGFGSWPRVPELQGLTE